MNLLCRGWDCICTRACVGKALLCYCRAAHSPPLSARRHSPVLQHVHALLDVWCVIPLCCTSANYHSAPRPWRCPSTDGCLIMTMSVMNAINLKWESGSHEEIKMTPLLVESLLSRKQDSVSQKWLWREAGRVLFRYLGYSIRLPLIFFSFIIEGSLVLYILLVAFRITLSTITAAVWTLFSPERVCLFFSFFFSLFTHTVLSVLFSQACYF